MSIFYSVNTQSSSNSLFRAFCPRIKIVQVFQVFCASFRFNLFERFTSPESDDAVIIWHFFDMELFLLTKWLFNFSSLCEEIFEVELYREQRTDFFSVFFNHHKKLLQFSEWKLKLWSDSWLVGWLEGSLVRS